MGISPRRSASTFAASASTQTTVLPFSARQAPTTRPTYPVPTTAIFRSPPGNGAHARPRRWAAARQFSMAEAGLDIIRPARMNIGLDLRPSLARPTGVGSYVLALARRLPALAPEDRFFLFSASLRHRYPEREWPANAKLVDRRLPVRLLNYAWHRAQWPPLDRLVGAPLDLTHSPHPLLLPATTAKRTVTRHDLSSRKHTDRAAAEIGSDNATAGREPVRKADGVICVSEHAVSEAQSLLDVPRSKIAVIPYGIDPANQTRMAAEEV